MLGYDQDRYAALLAASALETRRALARRMGYRETTKAGNAGPGMRDPELLEAIAHALTQREMTKPQLKDAVESALDRQVSIHTVDKYLLNLIRAGRAKRLGLVSANIPGKSVTFAVFAACELVAG